MYAYVGGSPVSLIDPSGMFVCVPCANFALGALGALADAVGGLITGGDFTSMRNGAITGGLVGLANPFGSFSAGVAATGNGVAAAAVGQIAGNATAGNSLLDLDVGGLVGAGLGGVVGQALGRSIALRNTIFQHGLGPPRASVVRSAEAFYGGIGAGIGEGGFSSGTASAASRDGKGKGF